MNIDELASAFMSLFAGLERAHGAYAVSKKAVTGEKRKGRAVTEHEPVTVALWREHLEGKKGLGIIPLRDDGTVLTAYGDIDSYQDFDLAALEQKITGMRLPLFVARSKSGGAHVILFLGEPVPARYIRIRMAEWMSALGYPGCEIFPKQDELLRPGDVGNWINMPYFDHANTDRYVIRDGEKLPAEKFVEIATKLRQHITREKLDAFTLTTAEDNEQFFADGPPCLQHFAKNGFPKGTRNRGLFNLGVLARFACGDDWQPKVEELNRQHMQPPLSSSEVANTIKSLSRKQYFYTCTQDPIASACSKDICRKRKHGIGNGDEGLEPIRIDNITMIMSDPPMFVVELEGVKFECTSDDLLSQMRFQKLVLERALKIMPIVKPAVWNKMVQEKLDDAQKIKAPDDAGPEGQFMSHLEQFCTGRAQGKALDEIMNGIPFTDHDKGVTYFRSPDLFKFLEVQRFKQYTERQMWAILKRRGAQHEQYSLKGKCVTAWSVPKFKEQTEPFAVPKIESEEL